MRKNSEVSRPELAKSPTGIRGLDEITFGGLPHGRPTLVCGRAGCGKTLFSIEFLVHGAIDYDEPGVFIAFEETEDDLTKNVASLGYDLADLSRRKKLMIDYIRVERSEIEETGEYDLEGLFVRLGYAIDAIGAKRVVLDTIEAIFSGFSNVNILRAELRRLFRWLKEKGVTAVITAEQGDGTLTRHGLEEYVSDCVILLDHRVHEQISTRRLRVVKYRGSIHGTNEYPFLIDDQGISVLPITSLNLEHRASSERVSTGIETLDQMFGGKGYYRGSSILVSGMAGTGKTSVAAQFVDAACRRGERCIYFSSEESPAQVIRNLRAIGLDLEPWIKKGLLHFDATRPNFYGLEMHLLRIHKLVERIKPKVVVFDPLSNYLSLGNDLEVQSMLTRLLDYLKGLQITSIFNTLVEGGHAELQSEVGVSSLMDVWILLRNLEYNGERNRGLFILKARGSPIPIKSANSSSPIMASSSKTFTSAWTASLREAPGPRTRRARKPLLSFGARPRSAGGARLRASGVRSRRRSSRCERNLKMKRMRSIKKLRSIRHGSKSWNPGRLKWPVPASETGRRK